MNNKASRLVTYHALTFLHPGTGQSTGVVDLPIQREKHTGFPIIQSSGLKGSLRDKAEQIMDISKDDDKKKIEVVFGTKDNGETAGALAVTDARILAFPMRSLQQVFIWITCPMVLNRLVRDLVMIGQESMVKNLSQFLESDALKKEPLGVGQVLLLDAEGFKSPLVLEEYTLTIKENALDGTIITNTKEELSKICQELNINRLAIVSEDDFQFFVRHATQVSARIKLNDKKTTTGGDGNLWYEETLPPETIFYSLFLASKPRDMEKSTIITDEQKVIEFIADIFPKKNLYLQLGGNETVGQGWCKVQILGD